MSTAGVVAEYNPFHRGHAWHLERTRAALGPEGAVVCVMSGHWTQGGRCALADKWTRAALALEGGADLVLELPVAWATASAERFARGAVELLAATGVVDTLSFGSEAGDLAPLSRAAACLDHWFRVRKQEAVVTHIRPQNLPSRRVADRNGMQVRGQIVKHYYGMEMPHVGYSVRREEREAL